MKDKYWELIRELKKEVADISDSMRLSEDIGLDSLNIITLLTRVEDEYHIRFRPDEDDIGAIFDTVGSLWAYIEQSITT